MPIRPGAKCAGIFISFMILTHDELKQILFYDPDTGLFKWIIPPGRRVDKKGQVAGSKRASGYISICIRYKAIMAHRLAWFYMTGSWPKHCVDHINMVKDDNRWINLREATKTQNGANSRARGASGLKGAFWQTQSKVWYSKIGNRYLGTFKTPEEANAAYLKAAEETFGEFARG